MDGSPQPDAHLCSRNAIAASRAPRFTDDQVVLSRTSYDQLHC